MITVGSTIVYRPSFGYGMPKEAKVVGLTLTAYPRCKEGVEVPAVAKEAIQANKVLFDLDDGHWCYSEQVELQA